MKIKTLSCLDCDNNNMNQEITLCLGNIFDGGSGETKKYHSLDQMLNDGWLVD